MSSLLNFYDDALRAADDIADAARPYLRKSKNLNGQISIFDSLPTHKLAGFSRNKPVYQTNLTGLYDDLAPKLAQPHDYMEYLNGLSNTQIQNLIPQSASERMRSQADAVLLQNLESMSQNPDTQALSEILRKTVKT